MRAALKTPLTYQWVIPIIRQSMEKNSGIQYKALHGLIRPYAKDYAITTSLLQDARDAAKRRKFLELQRIMSVKQKRFVAAMRALGHSAELVYTSRDKTLAAMNTVVVNEEINRRKNKNEPAFDGVADRKAYWNKWKEDNALLIIKTLGIKGGPAENRFLSGIFVATSASKSIFNTTQEVVQADGAHTLFGEYTLFLAYSTTANANMSSVAFRILFGNGDIKNQELDAVLEVCCKNTSHNQSPRCDAANQPRQWGPIPLLRKLFLWHTMFTAHTTAGSIFFLSVKVV